jgi:retron-type reverse transcriptase
MAIEGDISSAFDNISHDKLIGILKKDIDDEDFLKIIKEACKTKIVNFDKLKGIKENITPELGTPQGFIMSPILFNIYMHDFDKHITQYLETSLNNTNKTRNTPLNMNDKYQLLDNKIRKLKKQNNKIRKINLISKLNYTQTKKLQINKQKISFYRKLRTKLPSRNQNHITLRWFYTRYADDFIILTNSNKKICQQIIEECTNYLDIRLSLSLNKDKTVITNLKEKPAKFMGFCLYMSNSNAKIIETNSNMGKIKRRGGSTVIKVGIDLDRRIKQLIKKKYAKMEEGEVVITNLGREKIKTLSRFNKKNLILPRIDVKQEPWNLCDIYVPHIHIKKID